MNNLKTLPFLNAIALVCNLANSTETLASGVPQSQTSFQSYALSYDAPIDSGLQSKLETIDRNLRAKCGMTTNQTAVGVLDLKGLRLAMLHPDREEYAASVA